MFAFFKRYSDNKDNHNEPKRKGLSKKSLGFLFAIIISSVSALIVIDLKDHSSLLQFRTSDLPYRWWHFCHADRTGLEKLHISGSGVLHESAVRESFKEIDPLCPDIYVVNLTEPDMLYANGRPFRWFNWAIRRKGGVKQLYNRPNSIPRVNENIKWYVRRHWYPRPEESLIETEEQLINRLGYHYASFYVNRREIYPPHIIDQFLIFVKQLPPHAWVHFHCDGGNSRTTTMMIFYDIIKNGKQVSLQTIMERQHALGGVNVMDTKPYYFATRTWKQQNLLMRKAMIEDFYRYVNDPQGYGVVKWSVWFATHGTAQKYESPYPKKDKKKKKKKKAQNSL